MFQTFFQILPAIFAKFTQNLSKIFSKFFKNSTNPFTLNFSRYFLKIIELLFKLVIWSTFSKRLSNFSQKYPKFLVTFEFRRNVSTIFPKFYLQLKFTQLEKATNYSTLRIRV